MKYQPYLEYRESGIEWLGVLPTPWEVQPLFVVLEEHYEQNIGMKSDDVLSLSFGEIVSKDVSDNWGLLPESFETYQLVAPNDIVLRLTDLQNDQRSLRTAISRLQGIITSAYLKLRCKENPDYFHWLLYAIDIQKVFYGFGGGVRQSMKYSDLKRLPLCIPPLPTQRAIAAFLDAETARIDSLVKEYEDLIALLAEKRTALISHAVTRGLSELVSPDDPEFGEWAKPVKFKDSGVEWIGEIPEGWEIHPIKRIVSTPVMDGPHETPELLPEGIPFLSAESVKDDTLDFDKKRGFISIEDHQLFSKKCKPKRDDIFMVKSGATTGNIAIVDTDIEFNIWSPLAVIRSDKDVAVPRYVFFYMKSKFFIEAVKTSWSYGTQQNIGMGIIENLRVVLPPLLDQDFIARYLDKENSRISALTRETASAISLLKEHRAALITNAVTGKINVERMA